MARSQHNYVGKTSSKIRKGYRHGKMRQRRKKKNEAKKRLRLAAKRAAKAKRMNKS